MGKGGSTDGKGIASKISVGQCWKRRNFHLSTNPEKQRLRSGVDKLDYINTMKPSLKNPGLDCMPFFKLRNFYTKTCYMD